MSRTLSAPAWLPTVVELAETEALDWTVPAPRSIDRSRELRWFLDEHLEWCGYDFDRLADYALQVGLYPVGTARAGIVQTFVKIGERIAAEVAA